MRRAGRLLIAGAVVGASPLFVSCSDRSTDGAPAASSIPIAAGTTLPGSLEGDFGGLTTASLTTSTPAGVRFDGCVLVADTADERAAGLMDRTDIGRFTGMAFVYDSDATTEFWMYRTPMPLSIAFIDGSGRVVSTADMQPCVSDDSDACERYGATEPYRIAVEVPAGGLAGAGLVDGASAVLGAPC
ncbi:MAG: DUF192 domain-containing protein [Acidimicrobiia bacterium]